MKRLLSILAAIAMVFTFSLAFGSEEVPTLNQVADQELGNVLFRSVPSQGDGVMMTRAGDTTVSGIEAARAGKDIGIALYDAELTRGTGWAKGAAAGGITATDVHVMSRDSFLGPGGSDLP